MHKIWQVKELLLCSSDHCLLHDAGASTIFSSRAFCHAAPTIWNSLPADVTDNFNNMLLSGFKCGLQTYFYKLSFTQVKEETHSYKRPIVVLKLFHFYLFNFSYKSDKGVSE